MRRAALPPKPEAYQVATTPNFKPPEGLEFKIDEADPLWTQARGWAHKNGLTQEAFNEGIDLFAGARIGDAATVKAAHDAEIAKLGANGTARVTALETFFKGLLGEADGGQMKQMLVTAGIVQAAEKMVAKFSSQGVATFSQQHREPGEAGGRVSQEAYDKMSPAARLDYNAKFDQSKMPAWRDPRAA